MDGGHGKLRTLTRKQGYASSLSSDLVMGRSLFQLNVHVNISYPSASNHSQLFKHLTKTVILPQPSPQAVSDNNGKCFSWYE